MTPMMTMSRRRRDVIISNKLYDFLKAFTMVVLPSSAAVYLGLSHAVNLPYSPGAVITTLVVGAILGIFLIIASKEYHESDSHYDGRMLIRENEEGELMYCLELSDEPELLQLKSRILFKVVREIEPEYPVVS